jgi:hypothetical protein
MHVRSEVVCGPGQPRSRLIPCPANWGRPLEQTQHTGERDRASLLHAFDTRNQPKYNLKRAISEYAGLLGTRERKVSSAARFDGLRLWE